MNRLLYLALAIALAAGFGLARCWTCSGRPIESAINRVLANDGLRPGVALRVWVSQLGEPQRGDNADGAPEVYWWADAGIAVVVDPYYRAQARRRSEADREVTSIVIPLEHSVSPSDLWRNVSRSWRMEFRVVRQVTVGDRDARLVSPDELAKRYATQSADGEITNFGPVPVIDVCRCASLHRSNGRNVAIGMHLCAPFAEYD